MIAAFHGRVSATDYWKCVHATPLDGILFLLSKAMVFTIVYAWSMNANWATSLGTYRRSSRRDSLVSNLRSYRLRLRLRLGPES